MAADTTSGTPTATDQELAGSVGAAKADVSIMRPNAVMPVTLGALARVEQVQPPTVTALTAKLEAAGLVVRTIDPGDRRIHRVTVTPAGAKLLARQRGRKNAFLDRRLRRLSDADRKVLARAAEIMEGLAHNESGTRPRGSA